MKKNFKGKPVAMTTETFVHGYKEQSQMDVNTINTLDCSAEAAETIGNILRSLRKSEDPVQ